MKLPPWVVALIAVAITCGVAVALITFLDDRLSTTALAGGAGLSFLALFLWWQTVEVKRP